MQYRRAQADGASFFFILVTENRKNIFAQKEDVAILNRAVEYTVSRHPFAMDAIVILPDHIHCIWSLPEGNNDFSTRWRLIKSHFTRCCSLDSNSTVSESRARKGEHGIWQRRFWEHRIRDERDYKCHVEYIHYNPVKHGYVRSPKDWPHSSFGRFVEKGIYELNWGAGLDMSFDNGIGNE
ncbi:MAG: transposase [Nitrospiraceae bacterium]|nr:transposase [Nitrospiraceae bacterium]